MGIPLLFQASVARSTQNWGQTTQYLKISAINTELQFLFHSPDLTAVIPSRKQKTQNFLCPLEQLKFGLEDIAYRVSQNHKNPTDFNCIRRMMKRNPGFDPCLTKSLQRK